MSTVADYAGRTVDMLALQTLGNRFLDTDIAKSQTLVRTDDGGMLIAGIQKLAQRVLITLLTSVGSKIYDPAFGTQFIPDARAGNWRTIADVTQSFYSARLDVARQLAAEQLASDPLDEIYNGMTLTDVVLSSDMIRLSIDLTSLAGTTYTVLAPITVPIN